jgi:hypothetical protein
MKVVGSLTPNSGKTTIQLEIYFADTYFIYFACSNLNYVKFRQFVTYVLPLSCLAVLARTT